MTESSAQALVTLLIASYPRERLDTANITAYRTFLCELPSEQGGREAIMGLIRTEDRLPSVAAIRRAYQTWFRQHGHERALPEPDVSVEQRRHNIRRLAALASRIGRPVTPEGQDG